MREKSRAANHPAARLGEGGRPRRPVETAWPLERRLAFKARHVDLYGRRHNQAAMRQQWRNIRDMRRATMMLALCNGRGVVTRTIFTA